jgi:hypothetical protein
MIRTDNPDGINTRKYRLYLSPLLPMNFSRQPGEAQDRECFGRSALSPCAPETPFEEVQIVGLPMHQTRYLPFPRVLRVK